MTAEGQPLVVVKIWLNKRSIIITRNMIDIPGAELGGIPAAKLCGAACGTYDPCGA